MLYIELIQQQTYICVIFLCYGLWKTLNKTSYFFLSLFHNDQICGVLDWLKSWNSLYPLSLQISPLINAPLDKQSHHLHSQTYLDFQTFKLPDFQSTTKTKSNKHSAFTNMLKYFISGYHGKV